jgi:hypothetical protein
MTEFSRNLPANGNVRAPQIVTNARGWGRFCEGMFFAAVMTLPLILLSMIAFGVGPTLTVVWWILTFPFRHAHAAWALVRVAAMGGVLFCVIMIIAALMHAFGLDEDEEPAPSQRSAVSVVDAVYRDRSPQGDADFANFQKTDSALRGHRGGFAPKFED